MGLLSKIFSNTRKPEGFFGRMMVNGMNGGGHARLAEWGLSHLTLTADANILDVGCGDGATVARLLKRCPQGTVTGIDYSPVLVKKECNDVCMTFISSTAGTGGLAPQEP